MKDGSAEDQAMACSLLTIAKENPVQATISCNYALQQLEQKRAEALSCLLVVPFAVARQLLTDRQALVSYLNTPELWAHRKKKKPKPPRDNDPGRVLKLVLEATFAGEAAKGYQSAWWYARALEDPFLRNINPADLPEHIKACGSLRRMYDAALTNNPRRKPGRDHTKSNSDPRGPEPGTPIDGWGEKKSKNSALPLDPSTNEQRCASSDLRKPAIRHSKGLIRKLERIARERRNRHFKIAAKVVGDEIVLCLPNKLPKASAAASGWLSVKILPASPNY